MIEIKRNSKELSYFKSKNVFDNKVIVRENNKIVFNESIVLKCDLKKGEYIHFLNDGKEWRFYSSDNKDGFHITKSNKNQECLQICSYPLVRMILKSTGYNFEKIFYVEETNTIHDKCPVFYLSPEKI